MLLLSCTRAFLESPVKEEVGGNLTVNFLRIILVEMGYSRRRVVCVRGAGLADTVLLLELPRPNPLGPHDVHEGPLVEEYLEDHVAKPDDGISVLR